MKGEELSFRIRSMVVHGTRMLEHCRNRSRPVELTDRM
jgi:hypothetical protein